MNTTALAYKCSTILLIVFIIDNRETVIHGVLGKVKCSITTKTEKYYSNTYLNYLSRGQFLNLCV